MKLAIFVTTTFTVLATAAYAGGNPDETDFGAGTRDPLPQAAPVIPDQYEIQRQIEAEVFAKPQIKPEPLQSEPAEEPVTIARAEPEPECWDPFQWVADRIGGGCYRNVDYYDAQHSLTDSDTRQVSYSRTTQVCFPDSKKGRKAARNLRDFVNSKKGQKKARKMGYDGVKGELTPDLLHVDITYYGTRTERFASPAERDDGPNGGTAGDSNGMRDNDIDSGNW